MYVPICFFPAKDATLGDLSTQVNKNLWEKRKKEDIINATETLAD